MNEIADSLGQPVPPGWDVVPIECDGVTYGEVMLQGNEIHVATCKPMSRRTIRAFAAKLLADKVFLTTRSLIGDASERFIRRLGFVQTNEDSQFRYWWLDELPFERKHHA